ncbi:MAG: glycosyltransferase [Desulfobacteraceae bacterium]|nr:MAG: glycosyltransferase [Desulfobacteraceae bacterium]
MMRSNISQSETADIQEAGRFVSIIIPALNEEKHIGTCLGSLVHLNNSKDSYEVILVDNGSTDNTRDIARTFEKKLNINVMMIKDVNVSTLRNIGVEHSKGDIFAFLDADCAVAENWLNCALPYFNDPKVGAAGCSHEVPKEYGWVAKTWDLNIAKKRKKRNTATLPSGNMFVSRERFMAVNGFDDELVTNEDFDLCFRLIKSGSKLQSDPNISAVHYGVPNNLSAFYKQVRWHGTHVFKVFISDLKKMNNFRAVVYSLYYFCALICLVCSLFLSVLDQDYQFLLSMIPILTVPPILMSTKTLVGVHSEFSAWVRLSFLYFVYGMARANSIWDMIRKQAWGR